MQKWNAVGHTKEQKPTHVHVRNSANQGQRTHQMLQPDLVFWVLDKVEVRLNNSLHCSE
jgi:hypothetical protein